MNLPCPIGAVVRYVVEEQDLQNAPHWGGQQAHFGERRIFGGTQRLPPKDGGGGVNGDNQLGQKFGFVGDR